MGLIAVLVNCALIGLSGQVHRMFPEMSTTQTILLIVALEVLWLTISLSISNGFIQIVMEFLFFSISC